LKGQYFNILKVSLIEKYRSKKGTKRNIILVKVMHTFTNAETGGTNCIPMCFSVLAYVE
jgi:hypothetical protein